MSSRLSTCLILRLGMKALCCPPRTPHRDTQRYTHTLSSILTAAYCFHAMLHVLASTENAQAGEAAAAQIWLPGYHRWLLYACRHISKINFPTSTCCLSTVKSVWGNVQHITHVTSTKCNYKDNCGSFTWIMRGCILDTQAVHIYLTEVYAQYGDH